MKREYDYVVVGAGIVGAATALALSQRTPKASIAVLEKEPRPACHQTGRNSGVIHAGVYYQPGSLKARFCREGLERTIAFCQQYQIPFKQCGKLIVSTTDTEEPRLDALYQRCRDNELAPQMVSSEKLKKVAPNITGKRAIWVEQSGITDYVKMTQHILALAEASGVKVHYGYSVDSLEQTPTGLKIQSQQQESAVISCEFMVNCAGIYADKIIQMTGEQTDFAILPFRGEYFRLSARLDQIVDKLIYPVPDPELPFLGVHLTPMIGGYLTVGPNAVLAGGKEAYQKWQFELSQMVKVLRFKGSWPLFKRYFKSGIGEFKDSVWKQGYLRRVQQYCPQVTLADLLPYRSGIRAQAVNADGSLEHDFRFVQSPNCLHVGNAPSPAATSAFPIADTIVDRILS